MNIEERFLKYVSFDTQSDEYSNTTPSTLKQLELGKELVKEMLEIGIEDAYLDEFGIVYGTIKGNSKNGDVIGFIAHMDTSPDASGKNIKPQKITNYDGSIIELNKDLNISLDPKEFPSLKKMIGHDLITTDGTTLLGADDKAGIAEILTMVERFVGENIPHGPISIAFTPDEEIGSGAAYFDLERFGAKFAYTLDGDTEGEIQFENFNACKADFEIEGFNVHPGSSKDIMINASLVAMEINACLPSMETPRNTENYEGFYHLIDMSGDVSHATLHYIVRDHDPNLFEAKKETLRLITKNMNEKWGDGCVSLTITDQYKNMAEIIKDCPHLIENTKKACEMAGVTPLVLPIRGGTDGCQLSFRGLPCPNLGTGGHAYHGPYEHITVEGMNHCVDIIVELICLYSKVH